MTTKRVLMERVVYRQLTRRELIIGGGVGVAAALLVGCGRGNSMSSSPTTSIDAATGLPFSNIKEMRSSNGILDVELVAASTMLPWLKAQRFALTYNGSTPGPTLRVRPGDLLRVKLTNNLDEPTNLHTHGLHVSPSGKSDNPMIMVNPGESFTYEFAIPQNHVAGTFWYHPHHHGLVASQVLGGMAGVIIVEDSVDDSTEFVEMPERILVLSDPIIGGSAKILKASQQQKMAGREGDLIMVNGVHSPIANVRPGSRERWRILNASPSRYYNLGLTSGSFSQIGTDQGRFAEFLVASRIVLTPGQRAEVVVDMPTKEGSTLELFTDSVERGMSMHVDGGMGNMGGMGGMSGMMSGGATANAEPTRTKLLTFKTEGTPALPVEIPRRIGSERANPQPTAARDVSFGAMSMGIGEFVIDGKSFDPERVDISLKMGAVEEWTITNNSMMMHPFHLHTWPFTVVARSDGSNPDPGWRDTVNIPGGSSVTIRIPFEDHSGTTVYHCHILDHEDLGMMGVINVKPE